MQHKIILSSADRSVVGLELKSRSENGKSPWRDCSADSAEWLKLLINLKVSRSRGHHDGHG